MFGMSVKSVPGCLVSIVPRLIGVPVAVRPAWARRTTLRRAAADCSLAELAARGSRTRTAAARAAAAAPRQHDDARPARRRVAPHSARCFAHRLLLLLVVNLAHRCPLQRRAWLDTSHAAGCMQGRPSMREPGAGMRSLSSFCMQGRAHCTAARRTGWMSATRRGPTRCGRLDGQVRQHIEPRSCGRCCACAS